VGKRKDLARRSRNAHYFTVGTELQQATKEEQESDRIVAGQNHEWQKFKALHALGKDVR